MTTACITVFCLAFVAISATRTQSTKSNYSYVAYNQSPVQTIPYPLYSQSPIQTLPAYSSIQTLPSYSSMQTLPAYSSMQTLPAYSSIQTLPAYSSMQTLPSYSSIQTLPAYSSVQTLPTYASSQNLPAQPTNVTFQSVPTYQPQSIPVNSLSNQVETFSYNMVAPVQTSQAYSVQQNVPVVQQPYSIPVAQQALPVMQTVQQAVPVMQQAYTIPAAQQTVQSFGYVPANQVTSQGSMTIIQKPSTVPCGSFSGGEASPCYQPPPTSVCQSPLFRNTPYCC